jgi:hypothetical protein
MVEELGGQDSAYYFYEPSSGHGLQHDPGHGRLAGFRQLVPRASSIWHLTVFSRRSTTFRRSLVFPVLGTKIRCATSRKPGSLSGIW